jgi:predicted Zn-dependent protease
MSKACYDPRQTIAMWKRMSELEHKRGMDNPIFKYLSTHPLGSERVENLQKWLPEAMKEAEKSKCTSFHAALKQRTPSLFNQEPSYVGKTESGFSRND